MEIDSRIYDKIKNLFTKVGSNKNYELEVRVWGQNFKYTTINYNKFKDILQKLTFKKKDGGLGYNYEQVSELDVRMDNNNIRLSLLGIESVKKYWLTEDLNDLSYILLEKERQEIVDIDEYNVRVALSTENEIKRNGINDWSNKTYKGMKTYRYKNRYVVKSDDGLFKFDLTSVKVGKGQTFKQSNALNRAPVYEIEIEYLGGGNIKKDNLVIKLLNHICFILTNLQDNPLLLKQSTIDKVVANYKKLINIKNNNNLKYDFIAANPVTLHRKNMIQSSISQNILNKYAVTLKADGERNLLYVMKSNDENLNGIFYLLNINMDVKILGYKDSSWAGSILEGELIEDENIFLIYDMLFSKENDIRRNHLNITLKKKRDKNRKSKSRMEHLEQFYISSTRKMLDSFKKEFLIEIRKKKYKYSSHSTEIFKNAYELWNSRDNNPYKVDGMIFIPIMEHYPLKGGAWRSLFKWKPEKLNTIDFLVSVKKNEKNQDIRNPFICRSKNLNRIQQYKILKLFIGGMENIYDKRLRKMIKKKVPKIFNPFQQSNEDANKYNEAKILLDENENMYAEDSQSGKKSIIMDDTIIEFAYDQNNEDGFNWIPMRVRDDKTLLYRKGKEVYGNSEKTANDIFRNILNPVKISMFEKGKIPEDETIENNSGDKMGNSYYKNNSDEQSSNFVFHNFYVKEKLLKKVAPAFLQESRNPIGKILDLATGRGTDIARWKRTKFAEALGIDKDIRNIEFAKNLFKQIPRPKPKTHYIPGDISKLIFPNQEAAFTDSNKGRLKEYIPIKNHFDVVSINFALHYFFENEIVLRTLCQNISDNLKQAGFFIGMCLDGDKVYNALKGKSFGKGISGEDNSGKKIWEINKEYKNRTYPKNKPNYGRKINVMIPSFSEAHSEYLVSFSYLDIIMKEYGLVKVEVSSFEELYTKLGINHKNSNFELKKHIEISKNMTDDEKKFSFMHNIFIYKKMQNAPDSLFKKLVGKIEKKESKKNKKSNVKTVNQNEENNIVKIEENNIKNI